MTLNFVSLFRHFVPYKSCHSDQISTLILIEQSCLFFCFLYLAIFFAIPSRLIAGILTAIVFSLMLPTIINTLDKHFKINFFLLAFDIFM